MRQHYLDNPESAFDLEPDFPRLIYNIRIIGDDQLGAEHARVRQKLLSVERSLETLQEYYEIFEIPGLSLTRVSTPANRERRVPYTSVTLKWKVRIPESGIKSQDQKRTYCEFDDPLVQGLLAHRGEDFVDYLRDVEYRREYINLHLRVWWSAYDIVRQAAVDRCVDHLEVCHKNPLAPLDLDEEVDYPALIV